MFGARIRIFTTRSLVDVASVVKRLHCVPLNVHVTRYCTRLRQLSLAHPEALKAAVVGMRVPSLLPVRLAVLGRRLYATDEEQKPSSTTTEGSNSSILTKLLEEEQQQPKALTVGERVVQAGKDTTYFIIICIGFGITAVLLYYVFGELFSSNSVQRLFSAALTRIRADEKSKAILGEPISAHGEMSGRNRRRHISHQEYIVDGVEYMRMQFYVSGSKQQATAHLDLKKNSSGKYECRFLFLELSGYPGGTIIIEDNR